MDASLAKTIENLSQKSHVISDEAKKAKQDLLNRGTLKEITEQKWLLMESFSHSVDMLSTIFKKSHFDELALLIANPIRMMILNLVIGLIRGIGFATGVIAVVFTLVYTFRTTAIIELMLQLLSSQ
jgi:hypothetical protein